jgi:hypothetical protein
MISTSYFLHTFNTSNFLSAVAEHPDGLHPVGQQLEVSERVEFEYNEWSELTILREDESCPLAIPRGSSLGLLPTFHTHPRRPLLVSYGTPELTILESAMMCYGIGGA